MTAPRIPAVSDPDWRAHAACARVDPDLHHPDGWGRHFTRQIDAAKTICRGCPVRGDCRSWITARESGAPVSVRQSIWAALTPGERHSADPVAGQRIAARGRPAPQGRVIDPGFLTQVAQLVDLGMSPRAIAERIGVPVSNVRRAAERVPRRAQDERVAS